MVALATVFGFSLSELIVVSWWRSSSWVRRTCPRCSASSGSGRASCAAWPSDLRSQSGIDDALRTEGLADDIAEESASSPAASSTRCRAAASTSRHGRHAQPTPVEPYDRGDDFYVVRDREYPREGADCYGAIPDNAIVYAEGRRRARSRATRSTSSASRRRPAGPPTRVADGPPADAETIAIRRAPAASARGRDAGGVGSRSGGAELTTSTPRTTSR